HGDRRRISCGRLRSAGNPDFLCGGAVLFRRHLAVDRGQRDDGYGRANPGLSPGPPIRRSDQEIEAPGPPQMNEQLGSRIAFTLSALLIFRIGTYIPLPGIDIASVRSQSGGIPGTLNMRAAHSLSIFALSIIPYITAAVLLQLVRMVG